MSWRQLQPRYLGAALRPQLHPFLSALLCPLLTVTAPRGPYIAFLSLPPHLSTPTSARLHVMLSVWFDLGLFSIDLEMHSLRRSHFHAVSLSLSRVDFHSLLF